MYYLNCFFIYSILGYIIETVYSIINNINYESGFLHFFWTPIYGIGTLLILFISKYIFKELHLKKYIETIIVFLTLIIILSLMELLGGYLIEIIFNRTFWDYSHYKYNIGKYICLEISLIWGILSIIVIYIIHPLFRKIIKKIPKYITYILILLFIIDIIYTIINGI